MTYPICNRADALSAVKFLSIVAPLVGNILAFGLTIAPARGVWKVFKGEAQMDPMFSISSELDCQRDALSGRGFLSGLKISLVSKRI